MTSPSTKKRAVKTPPGPQNYPLLEDIHTIVPMPLITYANPELGNEFKTNACRLTRDVTQDAPSFDTYPLCFTLPKTEDSFDWFITAMRSTVKWLAHKKGSTGRTPANKVDSAHQQRTRPVGPTKVHDYAWTFHCPSFGQRRVSQSFKSKPSADFEHSQLENTTIALPPPALRHLVHNPEYKITRKRKPSYKCGCPAKFMVRRRADNGLFEVEWFWKHTGHNPFNIEDMRHQRMSAPLRTWLDKRLLSGLTWKTISKLLQTPDLFPVCILLHYCGERKAESFNQELDVSLARIPEAF